MKTVAIIGGGFSGTLAAVNLARLSTSALRVVVINCRRPFGRGVAYGADRPEHLLNVAARNMSALPDHPAHFVDWLRSRCEFSRVADADLREAFVPRRVYGDYLCGLAMTYLHPIDPKSLVELQVVDDEAVDVSLEGETAVISLKSGETVTADTIVLATGNQPPAKFPCNASLAHDPRYCADPWEKWYDRLPTSGGHVVLLGAGLTAVDVIVTLAELNWQGRITAISRSGLLPKSHFRGIAYPDYVAECDGPLTFKRLATLVQEHCQRLERMSQNPAIAVDKLRPHTQRLWQAFSLEEKRDFLSRYAAKWNSARHRIATAIHQRVTDALDDQKLRIVEGAVESLTARDESLDVQVHDADRNSLEINADLVINCTGPEARLSNSESTLLRNLLNSGLIGSDELDLGVAVDADFKATSARQNGKAAVYAIGPLLRGTLWETTAVPEIRVQAMALAQTILQQQKDTVHEDVIEYCI